MINVKTFVFNPFQENTYILSDESGECVVVDPGCWESREEKAIVEYIESNKLKPVRLINTHGHVDHVCGTSFISTKYGLKLEIHKDEIPMLERSVEMGKGFGFTIENPASAELFLTENDTIAFGNSLLKILHLPGHSKGSLAFYSEDDKLVITGDVLFRDSIGRSDLPGGNYDELIDSINNKLMKLGEDFRAYPGHGPVTTLGFEMKNNGFLQ
jgi:glyoxylase-like metal-dependent hydrolase (beta-lactamase superfamily II)